RVNPRSIARGPEEDRPGPCDARAREHRRATRGSRRPEATCFAGRCTPGRRAPPSRRAKPTRARRPDGGTALAVPGVLPGIYEPRSPAGTVLNQVVRTHLERFLAETAEIGRASWRER